MKETGRNERGERREKRLRRRKERRVGPKVKSKYIQGWFHYSMINFWSRIIDTGWEKKKERSKKRERRENGGANRKQRKRGWEGIRWN